MAGRNKGTPKTGGRVKGTPNKVSSDLRQMILDSLDKVGGIDYLIAQAHDNPVAYVGLVAKVLPKDLNLKTPDGFSLTIKTG